MMVLLFTKFWTGKKKQEFYPESIRKRKITKVLSEGAAWGCCYDYRDYNCLNLGNIKNDNNFSIFIDSSFRKDGETNAFHFK